MILSINIVFSLQMNERLFFYSESADKDVGRGVHERVQDTSKYNELNKIKDWRKILSNFYISPFIYENKTWRSVEHAFQSRKIALQDKEKAEWFHIESGHEIGQGDGIIARKHRTLVFLSKENIQKWNSMKSQRMKEILMAKFSQNELCLKTLLHTKDAELWHSVRSPPIRQIELESVRSELQKSF